MDFIFEMNFLRKIVNFTILFIIVTVWLYLDKLLIAPMQAITEIFSVGFPWNLMILTSIIYFVLYIFNGIKKLFISSRSRDSLFYSNSIYR